MLVNSPFLRRFVQTNDSCQGRLIAGPVALTASSQRASDSVQAMRTRGSYLSMNLPIHFTSCSIAAGLWTHQGERCKPDLFNDAATSVGCCL